MNWLGFPLRPSNMTNCEKKQLHNEFQFVFTVMRHVNGQTSHSSHKSAFILCSDFGGAIFLFFEYAFKNDGIPARWADCLAPHAKWSPVASNVRYISLAHRCFFFVKDLEQKAFLFVNIYIQSSAATACNANRVSYFSRHITSCVNIEKKIISLCDDHIWRNSIY